MVEERSLAARCESLLNRMVEARAEAQDVNARLAVERARRRAHDAKQDLDSIGVEAPLLMEKGVSQVALTEALRIEVRKARTALRSTATASVGETGTDVAKMVGRASVDEALTTADRCAKFLVKEWNRSVELKRVEILPDGIGNRIVAQPGQSDRLVAELTRVQLQLQMPVSGLDIESLRVRLGEILENVATWADKRPELDVVPDGESPEVGAFKTAAASEGGAAWELVTAKVLEYLADPENAGYYRVFLR